MTAPTAPLKTLQAQLDEARNAAVTLANDLGHTVDLLRLYSIYFPVSREILALVREWKKQGYGP